MKGTLFLAFILCLIAPPALALKISPFKAAISADNPAASQIFRVDNNSSEPAAVQVSVQTWDVFSDGSEQNADAESDFIVFPAQFVLKPHESRAVRVQWLGQVQPDAEKPYRLVAEQLPVALDGTPGAGSAVRFMLRFKVALYVSSGDVKSNVGVTGVAPASDKKLLLTLANKGTGHALLRNPVLRLKLADGLEEKLAGAALKPLEGENIHAGRERIFEIHLPPGIPPGKVAFAALDFEPAF